MLVNPSSFLIFFACLLPFFVTSALGAMTCDETKSICEGDMVYVAVDRQLHSGILSKFLPDYKASIRLDTPEEGSFVVAQLTDLASTRISTCAQNGEAGICPGQLTKRRIASDEKYGIVLGVFQNHTVIVAEIGEPVRIFSPSEVEPFNPSLKESVSIRRRLGDYGHASGKAKPKAVTNASETCQHEQDQSKSPNIDYFRWILSKGMNATLDELLVLWQPKDRLQQVDTYFLHCRNPRYWNRPVQLDEQGRLIERCVPDVLYSWGSEAKLREIMQRIGALERWETKFNPKHPRVWATISAVGSFSYGLIPIRIKFKKETIFLNTLSPRYPKSTVSINTSYPMNDFIINSPESIDSWSYGTAELYDEIVKDLRRILREPAKGYIAYFDYLSYYFGGKQNPLFTTTERDIAPRTALKQSLLMLVKQVLNNEGQVFFRPGSCQSRIEHYRTDKPTYFNER